MLLALILTAPILWNAVEYKPAILRNPLVSHEEKLAIVRGE
jgi:hypothetical protein